MQTFPKMVFLLRGFLRIFYLKQLGNKHTCVTDSSATTIDLILVSDDDKVFQSGVLPVGISDHYIIFCTRKVKRGVLNQHKIAQICSMKN